jgi:putative hydrolase of the HAD superfamily
MELLDFIRSIKPDYKTGTICDAWWDARNNLKQFIIRENFDVIVFSAEEGLKKPDSEIYLRTLERLGVDPQEAIFVDDRLPNVAGARQVGLHAIQYKNTTRTVNAILQLLCLDS